MKTLRIPVFALLVLVFVLPAFGQENKAETSKSGASWSNFYYMNVPLEKVYPHRLGYVVTYRKGDMKIGQAYLPFKWFEDAAGKGELVKLPTSIEWPYLVIYYKDGVFSHIRLFVNKNLAHESWGNLPPGVPPAEKFDIEELKLEF